MRVWGRTQQPPKPRQLLGFVLFCAQIFNAVGLPLPNSFADNSKELARPFPCQNRPCGCQTYDQCWAGACCCFTLDEKVAWAKDNGIIPPLSAVQTLAATQSKPQASEQCPSCCEESSSCCKTEVHNPPEECPACEKHSPVTGKISYRWVLGVAVLKCHGHGFGFLSHTPALPLSLPTLLREFPPFLGYVRSTSILLVERKLEPESPPPRLS